MLRLVLLFALVGFAIASPLNGSLAAPRLDGRIVGGREAKIEDFSYQLSLQRHKKHICGASILSPTRALTAAHCTDNQVASALTVRAGTAFREIGGTVVAVSKVHQHPAYDRETTDYDVSVLVLSEALQFGSSVNAVALPNVGDELPTQKMATATGWGAVCVICSLATVLQQVDVPKTDDAACKQAYHDFVLTERMVCHGYPQGSKDACQGDSGGPLVADGVQVGIVSWGVGCAEPRYPGVYTRTANTEIYQFIKEKLK